MARGCFEYLAILLLAVSCSAPFQTEDFRPIEERDSLGRFVYDIDMSDSLCSYDILLYTRMDCNYKEFGKIRDIKVEVGFSSPSGKVYSETVYLPVSSFISVRRGTYDCKVEYRKDMVPVEWGMWQMTLAMPELSGLHGMGIINRKR